MSASSSFPSSWSSGDDVRGADPESEVAYSSDRLEASEVPDFGPFRVNSILTPKDLEIIRLKYQILTQFRLEVAILGERIALPHQDRIGLYEESLKVGLTLPIHYLVVEFFNLYRISPCSIASNS